MHATIITVNDLADTQVRSRGRNAAVCENMPVYGFVAFACTMLQHLGFEALLARKYDALYLIPKDTEMASIAF